MKPALFNYHAPSSVEEAASLLGRIDGAMILAGGQSLVPAMNMRLASPAALIDIQRIPGLSEIRVESGMIRVGAMVRHRQLELDAAAQRVNPLIREAMAHVAHVPIRNRGTVVGSLCHADAAAEMPMVLVLTGGSVVARSASGERVILASDFFEFHMTTTRRADEIVTEARFPALPQGAGHAFEEFTRRHGDYAIAAVGAILSRAADGSVAEISLAACGISSRPVRLEGAEAALRACHRCGDARRRSTGRRRSRDGRRRHACHRRLPQASGRGAGEAGRGEGRPARVRSKSMTSPSIDLLPVTSADPKASVTMTINGTTVTREVSVRMLLSDFLRHELGLKGTHVGCEHGVCGACTVMIDGSSARSCLTFAVQASGADIRTVESLADPSGALHPLQQAFQECHGLQCGYCTPGMMMNIISHLDSGENLDLSDEGIREMLSGNLCRCTGYHNIIMAVRRAAELMGKA